ncbi:MAG TPA: DUF4386 domain-containing protein [Gemmatimonadales bacterium]|nr:DUF4386 domain-containing protein [Gemmatimonadales bacterium]
MTLLSRVGLARGTGLLYLVVVLTGIFSLAYVPAQLVVDGDGAATVARIAASEGLFRLGIAAGFVCYLAFLLLPFAFQRLLGDVHPTAAMLMVVLAVVSVPISLYNLTHKLEILRVVGSALPADQQGTAVLTELARYGSGLQVAQLFWGLWLFPLGFLIWRSRRLPRLLGALLMLGCIGYLVNVFGTTLSAGYPDSSLAAFATRPAALGEIGTCLWLLIVGARAAEGDP